MYKVKIAITDESITIYDIETGKIKRDYDSNNLVRKMTPVSRELQLLPDLFVHCNQLDYYIVEIVSYEDTITDPIAIQSYILGYFS